MTTITRLDMDGRELARLVLDAIESSAEQTDLPPQLSQESNIVLYHDPNDVGHVDISRYEDRIVGRSPLGRNLGTRDSRTERCQSCVNRLLDRLVEVVRFFRHHGASCSSVGEISEGTSVAGPPGPATPDTITGTTT